MHCFSDSIEIEHKFPLHMAVLNKDEKSLLQAIKSTNQINELDIHGYTALHLAIFLVWSKGIDILLKNAHASALMKSNSGWTCMQECISISNPRILRNLMQSTIENAQQQSFLNVQNISNIFQTTDDFYLEIDLKLYAKGMNFAQDYFPSDLLRIWKCRNKLRIDLTLLNIDEENMKWLRGNISYLYHITNENVLQFFYINHDSKEINANEDAQLICDDIPFSLQESSIDDDMHRLLQSPVISERVVIEDAILKRSKSWVGNKLEVDVNGRKLFLYKVWISLFWTFFF